MKTLIKTLLLICIAICTTANAQNNKAEQDAIRKVIDQETHSYFENNYEKWAETWVQDSTTFRMYTSPTGNSILRGWDNVSKGIKESMKNQPPMSEQDMATWMHKFDYHFYINGNMATVLFKEGLPEKNASDETRTMIKQNGVWKIVGLTVVETQSYNLQNAMNNLKSFLGTWKMDTTTFKAEPLTGGSSPQNVTTHVNETPNGVETLTNYSFNEGGQTYSLVEKDEFISRLWQRHNKIHSYRQV